MEINLTGILAFVQAIIIAYIVYKQTIGKAKVDTRPDELRAYTEMQVELGKAAENLVEPLNRRIDQQDKELHKYQAEIDNLRLVVRKQTEEISELSKRVNELESKNHQLQRDLDTSVRKETRLSQKLDRVRKEIDTGPLPNGKDKQ